MENKITVFLKKPSLLFLTLGHRGFFNWMSDEQYLQVAFRIRMGKKMNIDNPQTYSDKIQWLKLYDHRPEYTTMVDKYTAKKWVADRIGEEYIIPSLGVWEQFDDIDFDELPNQFVLKCTHDSGGVVICKDKSHFDINAARRKLSKCLKRNYYWSGREWPYKNVKHRIIAEEYLHESALDTKGECLTDYKFFCFNGIPKIAYISKDHSVEPKTDFFDMDFNQLPIRMRDPNSDCPPSKPCGFERMKEIAASLSAGIPHLRVDFYLIGNQIKVGELTFYHCSGFTPIYPEEWDRKLGNWIELPRE